MREGEVSLWSKVKAVSVDVDDATRFLSERIRNTVRGPVQVLQNALRLLRGFRAKLVTAL